VILFFFFLLFLWLFAQFDDLRQRDFHPFLLDFLFAFQFVEEIIDSLFLGFSSFGLHSTAQFQVNFLSEQRLVLLDNGRLVVNVLIVNSDDSLLLKVLQCSTVSTLFHEEQLLAIPDIEVYRFDEGVNYTVLPMFACAVQT